MIIGPGGKNIKKIQEETGAKIEIEDDGTVFISGTLAESVQKAKTWIERMTEEVLVGKTYVGKSTFSKEYGALWKLFPAMMAWYIFLNWPTDTLGKSKM